MVVWVIIVTNLVWVLEQFQPLQAFMPEESPSEAFSFKIDVAIDGWAPCSMCAVLPCWARGQPPVSNKKLFDAGLPVKTCVVLCPELAVSGSLWEY